MKKLDTLTDSQGEKHLAHHYYQDLFDEALDGIIFWSLDEGIIEANKSACKIFECSYEDLKHKRFTDFMSEEEKNKSSFQELFKQVSVRDEAIFLMPNGEQKVLEYTSKLNTENGLYITIIRNVTERYKMEQKLWDRKRKFRSIFEGSIDGLLLWDDNFQVIDINPAGEKMFGLRRDDMVGQSILTILNNSKVANEQLERELEKLKGADNAQGMLSFEVDANKYINVEYSTKKNILQNTNLTTFRDVTERIELKERIQRSDTLSIIGQLAAGIAHEIRNPMTALKGFIQLLEDSSEGENPLYFEVIKNELDRIESIINEFLILAKPKTKCFVWKNIVKLMEETIDLLRPQALLHNIQFQFSTSVELLNIYCEPHQLKKVFINIIKNAIEVMTNGGTISIRIDKTNEKEIQISIKDEGYGMTEEQIKKLGEPFYTTKDKGTGLGLMVSFQIIEDHHGKIAVQSELEKGTTFHIYLPYNNETVVRT